MTEDEGVPSCSGRAMVATPNGQFFWLNNLFCELLKLEAIFSSYLILISSFQVQ